MLRVRYPDGQEITYNDANFLEWGNEAWHLYTKDGGKWIASIQVSSGVIVETVCPCSVRNPLAEYSEQTAMEIVVEMFEEHRHADGEITERIKAALRLFDMRSWSWK